MRGSFSEHFHVENRVHIQINPVANGLAPGWDDWFSKPVPLDAARELVVHTRAYLAAVPKQASATKAQRMATMMAQDFQDLSGQVI